MVQHSILMDNDWNKIGTISFDNNICKISGQYSAIYKDIDLTNYRQLLITHNIPQDKHDITFEILDKSFAVRLYYPTENTNGWQTITFDIDGLIGIYTIKITAYDSQLCISNIILDDGPIIVKPKPLEKKRLFKWWS